MIRYAEINYKHELVILKTALPIRVYRERIILCKDNAATAAAATYTACGLAQRAKEGEREKKAH